MAKNPLFTTEYYMFSGMYDDSLIFDFFKKISKESYTQAIDYQKHSIGRERYSILNVINYNIKLGDFIIDEKSNKKYNLPIGSYTAKIDKMVLPISNKRKFINKYGLANTPIPLIDFYTQTKIFNKSMTVQIDKYFIFAIYFILNEDKSVTIAISNSNTSGLSTASFNSLVTEVSVDANVYISDADQNNFYYTSALSAGTINANVVTLNNSSLQNNIAIKQISMINSWDCFISYDTNNRGQNLLVSTNCTQLSVGASTTNFDVNEIFLTDFKSRNTSMIIAFLHKPHRKSIIEYDDTETSIPIINLNYIENPTSGINIDVYEYDLSTHTRKRRLYDETFSQLYFPNIFNFNTLNTNDSDLLIELNEYSSIYTNQKVKNSLSNIISSLGNTLYINTILNNYIMINSENKFKTFKPTAYPISLEDYIISEYYGDLRGYILDKLEKTIISDPLLYKSYYNWIKDKFNRVVIKSGTPKTFKFGGSSRGNEFTGTNTVVNDTSFISNKPSDIEYFSTPHSYITYSSKNKSIPFMLSIDGKHVSATTKKFYKGLNYVFYPVSDMDTFMSRFTTSDQCLNARPIILETYPDAYNSYIETPKETFTINSTSDLIKIFQDLSMNETFSLSDLTMVNATTNEFINILDNFEVLLDVDSITINNPETKNNENIVIESSKGIEYLITNLEEIYCTKDLSEIILSEDKTTLSLNNYLQSLVTAGIFSSLADARKAFSNKKYNLKDISFKPLLDSLIGSTINVNSSNYFYSDIVLGSTAVKVDDHYVLTFSGGTLDDNLEKYFLYKNGKFVSYDINLPTNQDTNIKVLDHSVTINPEDIYQLVHLPVSYQTSSWNFVEFTTPCNGSALFLKSSIGTGTSIQTIWPGPVTYGSEGVFINDTNFNIHSMSEESATNLYTLEGYLLPTSKYNINGNKYSYYNADEYGIIKRDSALQGGISKSVRTDYPFMQPIETIQDLIISSIKSN